MSQLKSYFPITNIGLGYWYVLYFSMLFSVLLGCQTEQRVLLQFKVESLVEKPYCIQKDSLARITGIQCTDTILIVSDRYSGKLFSLFNNISGKCLGRMGTIGNGPGELSPPCGAYTLGEDVYVYSPVTGIIVKYSLPELLDDIQSQPVTLTKYQFDFPQVNISALIPINDSIFLGAGTYYEKYQYFLFNQQNIVLDYKVDVFNIDDTKTDIYAKIIANSGRMVKHPTENKFVFYVHYSSNIDFIKIADNKISLIRSNRERDPILHRVENGGKISAYPDKESSMGYVGLAAGEKYLYALYSDESTTGSFSSNRVRVFDWDGNPMVEYLLSRETYYIAVNEQQKLLYAAVKDDDGGWDITSYQLR